MMQHLKPQYLRNAVIRQIALDCCISLEAAGKIWERAVNHHAHSEFISNSEGARTHYDKGTDGTTPQAA